jgi:hypothetical protein
LRRAKISLHRLSVALAVALAALAAGGARAEEKKQSDWSVDPGIYIFVPGLSGTVTVGPIDINVGEPSDAALSLNAAFMGNVRVGYKNWAFTSDFLHGNIHAEVTNDRGNTNSGDFVETVSDNTFSYRVAPWFEPLVGFRYDYISATLYGQFGVAPAGSSDWFDPIVGFNISGKATDSLILRVRADVGGFSVGSKLTWQVFPHLQWQVSDVVSLLGGYRVLYVDYEEGQDLSLRRYIITEMGIQIGILFTPRF